MKQMIDELKDIPGVVGACIFNSREGMKISNLPGIFKPDRLAAIGKHLAKLSSAGRMSFDDLSDISLHYDESVVVVRELQKNLLIFVICDPSFNYNLLTMSFNLLQEEIEEGGLDAIADAVSAASPSASAGKAAPDKKLLALLGEMKEQLGKVLGPMAGFIFDETVEAWEKHGADMGRVDDLLDLLNREIADSDKVAYFRKLIEPELKKG